MQARERAAAVIVAAGYGRRFGAPDKILVPLAGKSLLTYSLDAVESATSIDQTVVVVGAHIVDRAEALIRHGDWRKATRVVIGGALRQDSVTAGIAAIQGAVDVVALHDGARPFAQPALFDATVAAARRSGAAIAAVPVTDTIKRVEHGRILETVPRNDLWAAQTPQAFNLDLLRTALDRAAQSGFEVTDEAALFEWLNWPVDIVPGSPDNLKVTYPEDIDLAEAWLHVRTAVQGDDE